MARKSEGPQKSTTQATRLRLPGEPQSPSNSFTPAETPSMLTRWPPAEPPQTPIFSGIDVVLLGVGLQPADGRLAVVDLGGPDGHAREAILDRHAEVIAGGREGDKRPTGALLVAPAPAAAVDERRSPAAAFRWAAWAERCRASAKRRPPLPYSTSRSTTTVGGIRSGGGFFASWGGCPHVIPPGTNSHNAITTSQRHLVVDITCTSTKELGFALQGHCRSGKWANQVACASA